MFVGGLGLAVESGEAEARGQLQFAQGVAAEDRGRVEGRRCAELRLGHAELGLLRMLEDKRRLSIRTFESGLAVGILDGLVEAGKGPAEQRRNGRRAHGGDLAPHLKAAGAGLFGVGEGVLRHGNTRLEMDRGTSRVGAAGLQCLGRQIRCFHFQQKRRSDALHI
ncbi:hypothetical protein QNM99_23050 [Pseudomonas sp. PCH446]